MTLFPGQSVRRSLFCRQLVSVIGMVAGLLSSFGPVRAQSGVLVGHGENQRGELNAPIPTLVTTPRLLASGIKRVHTTAWASFLLTNDNTLLASGYSPAGNWNGDTSAYEAFTPIATEVSDFSAVYNIVVMVDGLGRATGWGRNTVGQVGPNLPDPVTTRVEISTEVASVAAGDVNTLWVKTDGSLWGMGGNFGNPFALPDRPEISGPVQFASGVTQAINGGNTALFIKSDGSLWGAGINYWGQLGLGHRENQDAPVKVADNVLSASSAGGHTMFIDQTGTLWGMGFCENGELGPNASHPQLTPVVIASNVASVSTGIYGTLFVDRNGTAWGYGQNNSGQLGLGDTIDRAVPTPIMDDVEAVSLSTYNGLILKKDGTAWGMGLGSTGQLGPSTTVFSYEPQRSISRVRSISSEAYTTFFIRDDLTLWAVGSNDRNLRGLPGTTPYSDHANLVATSVVKVSNSNNHAMFIKSDGTLWFLGSRDNGRWGIPFTPYQLEPEQIATGAIDVAARAGNSYYVDSDGILWGSGENAHYQLGQGHTNQVQRFTQIATDVAQVAAGEIHTLFIKTDGSLWGMGRSVTGELGTGTGTEAPTPVFIAHNVAAAATGQSNSYFLTKDGRLWGLGINTQQQLGVGGSEFRNDVPRLIATGVRKFAAGTYHVVWIDQNGELWGRGRAAFGELSLPLADFVDAPRHLASQVLTVAASQTRTLYTQVPESYLTNLSTRVRIPDTGGGRLSAGFVISGNEPLTALIRAVGPTLATVDVEGAMPDPSLQLFNANGDLIATNEDWGDSNGAQIASVAAELGAFALPAGSADSAMLVTLPPGGYSAVIDRGDTPGGVVLLEVYNRHPRSWRSRLVNLSVRTHAGNGDDTLTAGFVVEGERDARLLVRAVGPTLGDYGVPGVLADPQLAVLRGSTTLATNDDWAGDPAITADANDIGAFALPTESRDAAAIVGLPAGVYSSQVRTKSDATGNAIIEVYLVDN